MIVVVGAAGSLGSKVVENLLRLIPASKVRASARNPAKAGPLSGRGVDISRGVYDDRKSLARSFEGADRLLLISASGIEHNQRSARHRNAIDAAIRVGVKHVYLHLHYSTYTLHDGEAPRLIKQSLVPIPNDKGRHRAAPFGLGPWDGVRVASQQSPTWRRRAHFSCGSNFTNPG